MGNHFKHSSTMHRLFAAQRRYAARAAAAVACAAPLFAIDRPDPAHMLLMRRTPAPRLFSAIEDAIVPHADADQNIKLLGARHTAFVVGSCHSACALRSFGCYSLSVCAAAASVQPPRREHRSSPSHWREKVSLVG